jgi:Icc-related predicted phosphoesterase
MPLGILFLTPKQEKSPQFRVLGNVLRRSRGLSMKIFAISDIHGALKPLELTSEHIKEADLVTISGDISKKGSRQEALEVLGVIEKLNKNILAVHGNMDREEVSDLLEEKGYGLHGDGKVFGGIGFFGVGGSSKTPMNTRCEYTEEQISAFMAAGYGKLKHVSLSVLISHSPPHGTCDRTFWGTRAGSKSVARFIRDHAIALCIAGHIHEASGVEKLDRTIVANPGSLKSGRFLSIEIGDTINVAPKRV